MPSKIEVKSTRVVSNVNVKVPMLLTIALDNCELTQLVCGAEIAFKADNHIDEEAAAYCKLMHYAFNTIQCVDPVRIECKAIHIKYWVKYLQARMLHCEEVRDREKTTPTPASDGKLETFNKDTYITQKLLLINLKEALMVEVIE